MSQLRISGVSKNFGNFQALQNVDLAVNEGEFICLLGGSGCGKTTLLRLVAGLDTPTSGSIQLGGADLGKIPCHKRNIGMVFQSLALFPHLNVEANVAYGLKLRGVGKADRKHKAHQLLKMVGLQDLAQRQVSALSGGQKQRVAIARALAIEPHIFLMDEPFSALDAGLRDHLQVEVKKIQQTLGVTTLFVTHDQREAMALADRIVVLNEGRIEQVGTPDEIYSKPATRFVAEFIGDSNLFGLSAGAKQLWLGDQSADLPSALISGTVSLLMIRPEALNLKSKTSGFARTKADFSGKLVSQRRLGTLVERQITIGETLVRQTGLADAAASFTEGDTVEVALDWQQAWALPA